MSDATAPGDDPRDRVFVDHRPWGSFQQFVLNTPVTVKVISVAPGKRLSLQRHQQRGEMWQVLDVPLRITVGERTWDAEPGEMVWIPVGELHRVENTGQQDGRFLEVAFGTFDESDIERLEDDFGR